MVRKAFDRRFRCKLSASDQGLASGHDASVSALLSIAALLVVTDPRAKSETMRRDWAVLFLAVATAIVFPVYDLLFQGVVSQMSFYASFTLPVVAIATGALAGLLAPCGKVHRMATALIMTFAAIAMTWFGPLLWSIALMSPIRLHIQAFSVMGLAVLMLVVLARGVAPLRGLALVAFVGLQCLAFVLNGDTRQVFRSPEGVNNLEFFRAAAFVRSLLKPMELEGRRPLFWFPRSAFATRDGKVDSIAASLPFRRSKPVPDFLRYAGGDAFLGSITFLATLDIDTRIERELLLNTANRTLVVLAQDPVAFDEAREILGHERIACRLRQTEVYQSRSFVIRIALLDVLGERAGSDGRCDE